MTSDPGPTGGPGLAGKPRSRIPFTDEFGLQRFEGHRSVEGDILRYTYTEAERRARQLARALLRLGIEPGEGGRDELHRRQRLHNGRCVSGGDMCGGRAGDLHGTGPVPRGGDLQHVDGRLHESEEPDEPQTRCLGGVFP